MIRRIHRLWLTPLLLGSACALALDVGEIQIESARNQLFDAIIPLPSLVPKDLNRVSAKVASPRMFKEFGLDRSAWLKHLILSIQYDASGQVYIKAVSTKPVREPSLALLVEINWPRGKTFREFTVLLDPIQRAIQRPKGRSKTVLNTDKNPESILTAESTLAPAAVSGGEITISNTPIASPKPSVYRPGDIYGPVRPGEGLWTIAAKVRPDPEITREEMMQALFKANPKSFTKSGISGLKAGVVLRIPTIKEIAEFSGSLVARQIAGIDIPSTSHPELEAVALDVPAPQPAASISPHPELDAVALDVPAPQPAPIKLHSELDAVALDVPVPQPAPTKLHSELDAVALDVPVPQPAPIKLHSELDTVALDVPVPQPAPTKLHSELDTVALDVPAPQPAASISPHPELDAVALDVPVPQPAAPISPHPELDAVALDVPAPQPTTPKSASVALDTHEPYEPSGPTLPVILDSTPTFVSGPESALSVSGLIPPTSTGLNTNTPESTESAAERASITPLPALSGAEITELATPLPTIEPFSTTAYTDQLNTPIESTNITTAPWSKMLKPLAATAGVALINHDQIPTITPSNNTTKSTTETTETLAVSPIIDQQQAAETPEAVAVPENTEYVMPSTTNTNTANQRPRFYGPIAPNERLWDIADKVRPDKRIDRYVMMKALFAKNPKAFTRPDMSYLRVGATLQLPSLSEIAKMTGSATVKQLLKELQNDVKAPARTE